MEVYSIGFTKRSAGEFFGTLKAARVQRLLDVRLHNNSQLAGFSKQVDLEYFLRELLGASYEHDVRLAPTPQLLSDYRSKRIGWDEYETQFNELMRSRNVSALYGPASFLEPTALLCSKRGPEKCHRRLVLDYLRSTTIPDLVSVHL